MNGTGASGDASRRPDVVVGPGARGELEEILLRMGAERVVTFDDPSAAGVERAGGDPQAIRAVLGASPSDRLAELPSLTWVHSAAAGVDGWLTGAGLPQHVTLTSAVGNGAIPLAEHALLLMLMLSRDAPRWARAQAEHRWDRHVHGELAGAELGIIGYGHSGKDLARKALACHMRVRALRRRPGGSEEGIEVLTGAEGLRDLLRSSDMVVVTAPFTGDTAGMIGAEELALMRPGAFLIVISRGGIVQESALIEALRSGHLGGAGLDAHAVEPLPEDSPLWDLPGVIVTPHNGATTAGTAERGRRILLANLERWRDGQELMNVVDRVHGY
jgi:phosphoglycerate dehydrogenase-like enzyme